MFAPKLALSFIALATLSVAACGKKADAPTDADATAAAPAPAAADNGNYSGLMKALNDGVDQICACKDMACAMTAQKSIGEAMKGAMGKLTPDELAKSKSDGQAAVTRAKDCMMKLAAADKPAENNAAPAPTAAGGGDAKPAAAGDNDMLTVMTAAADKLCGCTTLDCITGTTDEWTKKAASLTVKPEDADKIKAVGERMSKCAQDAAMKAANH